MGTTARAVVVSLVLAACTTGTALPLPDGGGGSAVRDAGGFDRAAEAAGSPVCFGEGEPCSLSGGIDGGLVLPTPAVCRGGICCAGCWDGAVCRAGTDVEACGTGGRACLACAPTFDGCTATSCSGRCISEPTGLGTCGGCGQGGQICCAGSTCKPGFICVASVRGEDLEPLRVCLVMVSEDLEEARDRTLDAGAASDLSGPALISVDGDGHVSRVGRVGPQGSHVAR